MNWIDIIWVLLTLFSAGAFHMRKWLINHKMRLLNYSLFSILIISVSESLQTISRLSPIGSALHMLTYVLQASLVSYGVYHTGEAVVQRSSGLRFVEKSARERYFHHTDFRLNTPVLRVMLLLRGE